LRPDVVWRRTAPAPRRCGAINLYDCSWRRSPLEQPVNRSASSTCANFQRHQGIHDRLCLHIHARVRLGRDPALFGASHKLTPTPRL
jgi:hypothetical protein